MANADTLTKINNATGESLTFAQFIIFPKFATYFPKLIFFIIIFAIIMTIIFRVSIAPAPLTPNFWMLYDIIFGSHKDAEAKLDAHIRTAISLSNCTQNTDKDKDTFVSNISDINNATMEVSNIENVWTLAANKWQNIGKQWINKIFATLFISGHSINVHAPL